MSLNAMAIPAVREPGPLVTRCRNLTVAKVDSIGLVVRNLGIDVPDGCGLRVGGIERRWEEGRCVVFDDSFTHEAWNRSDQPRVVLVVDLWHPDLTDDEVVLLNGLHRYATANGTGLMRYWNRNRAKTAVATDRQSPPKTEPTESQLEPRA